MHWYSDLRECADDAARAEAIADYFDCPHGVAQSILAAANAAHANGNEGKPLAVGVDADDEYYSRRQTEKHALVKELCAQWWRDGHGDIARLGADDVARLVHSAWLDGIQRKDRVTVALVKCGDDVCECGDSIPADSETCPSCGSSNIDRQYYAEVHDDFAHLWAEWDQTIDGSSWDCAKDMPGFAYTILSARPGLAAELKAEGYDLDLSDYLEPDAA